MRTPNQRYGSPVEIAEYLGCTERTVRNLIARGKLPAGRLGTRSIRIEFSAADNLMTPIPTAGGGQVA
ncbi:helix-turn-helix transcriptional regulator [Enemella evansiae]|uniref:helix-turn-helix transcriptional regulator n=1 Tax=Enemella evansiae TaxID=2016499 RepID=UPI000B977AC2|nr:excisionase [Enemella evansiae]